jgi:hypothetical protein
MRHVASYAFEALDPSDDPFRLQQLARDCTEQWLDTKGDRSEDGKCLHYRDGRSAHLKQSSTECATGRVIESTLEEPIEGGSLLTSVKIGGRPGECYVSVSLAAATATLAPQFTEIRTPRLIRTLLELPAEWRYRGTAIAPRPIRLRGASGGDLMSEMTWDPKRCLPMIVVSEDHGFPLLVDLEAKISADLAALATVVRLDEDASWRMTQVAGREWSCYGAAIRVYWPGATRDQSPFRHPLWTPGRLLDRAKDVEDAAARLRRQLRRTILAQSAFAITAHPTFADIQHAARIEELEGLKQRVLAQAQDVEAANELVAHAAGLEEEKYKLELENRRLRDDIDRLQGERLGFIAALSSKLQPDEDGADIAPEIEAPPDSLRTAVEMAKHRFPSTLVFGEDAETGIADVRDEPRAAERVLQSLSALGELSRALRDGPIGVDILRWLSERGQRASGESETTRNSSRLMGFRTWGNGQGTKQRFEHHLKPKDGPPDRCIRIYFLHDQARQVVVVGYIGRHPPER